MFVIKLSLKVILCLSHLLCNVLEYIGVNQSQALTTLIPLQVSSDHTLSYLFLSDEQTDISGWQWKEKLTKPNHISLSAHIYKFTFITSNKIKTDKY